jgi:hypothetical protein
VAVATLPHLVVLLPVPRGCVYQPSAGICGDVIASKHHRAVALKQRVAVLTALQFSTPAVNNIAKLDAANHLECTDCFCSWT